jgi:hypothetical protein
VHDVFVFAARDHEQRLRSRGVCSGCDSTHQRGGAEQHRTAARKHGFQAE